MQRPHFLSLGFPSILSCTCKTGGVGYTCKLFACHSYSSFGCLNLYRTPLDPFHLPDPDAFFQAAGLLFDKFMPEAGNWVDVWESACNGTDPCIPMYQRYKELSNGTVAGFSEAWHGHMNHNSLKNSHLPDGTPVFTAPVSINVCATQALCPSPHLIAP